MQGEYSAKLLAQPFWLAKLVGRVALDNPLHSWLSKAFRPLDDDTGRGYNTFQQGRLVVQRFPWSIEAFYSESLEYPGLLTKQQLQRSI